MAMKIIQWKNADRRDSPRFYLQLRLALVYPGVEGSPPLPIYHWKSNDICMSGLSMVVDENVFREGPVTVLLALPPAHSWAAQKIISASAVMTYAIRSSKVNGYKVGMRFLEFKEDGKALLEAALQRELNSVCATDVRHPGLRSSASLPGDSQPPSW